MPHEFPTPLGTVGEVKRSLSIKKVGINKLQQAREAHPEYAAPFNSPEFLETLAAGYKGELTVLNWDSGLIPLVIPPKKLGLLGSANRNSIRYVGVIHDEASEIPQALSVLSHRLALMGILDYRSSFAPAVQVDTSKLGKNAVATDNTTCVLPLDNLNSEGVSSTADKRMKEKARSAIKNGLEIRTATETDVTRHLPRLLAQAYERNGSVTSMPDALPQALWNRHHKDSSVHMSAAYKDGEPVGVLVALTDTESAYSAWYTRTYDERFKNIPVLEALIAQMSKEAQEKGLKKYDLGGGTPGIIEFKKRMGASPIPYAHIDITHSAGRIVRKTRDTLRQLKTRA